MNVQITSAREIFMVVASWFLCEKKIRAGRNLPKQHHGKCTICRKKSFSSILIIPNHCVKSVKYVVFSGPYFPVFWLSTDSVFSPNIQSEYRKIQTRKKLRIWHFSRSESSYLRGKVESNTLHGFYFAYFSAQNCSRWGHFSDLGSTNS